MTSRIGGRRRTLTTWFCTLVCLGPALRAGSTAHAAGSVTFVNLSGAPVFVAKQVFVGGRSGASDAGPEQSGMGYYESPHYKHVGWATVEPGGSFDDTVDAWYYVEDGSGREASWAGLGDSGGVVKRGYFEGVKLFPQGPFPKALLDQGYRRVTYHKYRGATRYFVQGGAFRLVETDRIPIDFRSRDFLGITQSYPVSPLPGQVVDFSYHLDQRWADVTFTKRRNDVYLHGSLEGKRTGFDGAREPGYVTGWLKIVYTVPTN
jgi:hypothetical protein